MRKPQLLSPAGNLEKLRIAFEYGADAVYAAGKNYGLRAGAENFSSEDLARGADYTHSAGKKLYIAVNILAHNEDLDRLAEYIEFLHKIGVDGIIAADPGIISIIRETAPDIPLTLSTQANNTNFKSALFWHRNGISRITLARELSLEEIRSIAAAVPGALETEVFVHGAMCISYSGRCLLSSYLTGRDSNRGECAHPCRWKYSLVEEQRPGAGFPVFEDGKSTYIMNSRDLCLIRHIPGLIQSGVTSFKIEGRMKSGYYIAVTTSTYRKAIDSYMEDPEGYVFREEWLEELEKVSHRNYTDGFLISKPSSESQNYGTSAYIKRYDYLGLVTGYDPETGTGTVQQHNKICLGDDIEIIGPGKTPVTQRLAGMWDEGGAPIQSAPHPRQHVRIKFDSPVRELDMLRKEIKL
ncbi:MAG: U32 family peptidase [Elusimicrobia bacterium]|nr:U32 family peptidase [Elusimicrobiota bacterium]